MKSVMFLGLASQNLDRVANFNGELWTMNYFYRRSSIPADKIDRVYQIHHWEMEDKDWKQHYERCNRFVHSSYSDYGASNATQFDYRRLYTRYGSLHLGSTFAYMVADAIADGYTHIEFNGVSMLHRTEYFTQIPSVLQNIHIANKFGIKVKSMFLDMWIADFLKYMVGRPLDVYLLYGFNKIKTTVIYDDKFNIKIKGEK